MPRWCSLFVSRLPNRKQRLNLFHDRPFAQRKDSERRPPGIELRSPCEGNHRAAHLPVGKDPIVAQPHDWLTAAILVVRDRVIDHWMESTRETYAAAKRVYYLSLEFLIGRLMRDA